MQQIINFLFETNNWPPRWYCGRWTTALGLTHIISDILIFLAYFAIPCILVYFCIRIKGIFLERIFLLFALFIVFCGTGHLIEAIIFYQPIYRFAGLWKAITALISLLTVFALIPYIKQVLKLPKLKLINKELMEKLNLEQGKLKEANTKLANSHKILKEFSYKIAHDLKTPVRGVETYSKILLESDDIQLSPEVGEYVEKIKKSAIQSTKMITDILDYSIITSKTSEKSLLDIEKMLKEIIEEIPIINQDVRIDIAEHIPKTYGNPVTVREVFRNLIVNGIKYNNNQIKEIKINGEKNKKKIIYSVKDNGLGLSEKYLNLDELSKKRCKNSGTGLGLMIIKEVIENHNGKLWIESQEGKGTTFYFTFSN